MALWFHLSALAGYSFYLLGHLAFAVAVLPVVVLLLPFRGLMRRFMRFVFEWYVGFLTQVWLPLIGVYRIAEMPGAP